jgi:hypothetical protein
MISAGIGWELIGIEISAVRGIVLDFIEIGIFPYSIFSFISLFSFSFSPPDLLF